MYRLVLVCMAALMLAGCSRVGKILKSSDYDYKLKKGDEFFAKKKYTQAQTIYEDVFPVMKGTPKFENLYYNWAYCFYNSRDFVSAENTFKGFVENFPNSSRAEECEFMRAYCYYKQSPNVELDQTPSMKAITYLQTFIMQHPNSYRNKEAYEIIDKLRAKIEDKEYRSANLYYNLGLYKAAGTAFSELINNHPDSKLADSYKLKAIKSWYEYAKNSIDIRKEERFEKVLNECADFVDRFPDSELVGDVERIKNLASNNLKEIRNEQDKAST